MKRRKHSIIILSALIIVALFAGYAINSNRIKRQENESNDIINDADFTHVYSLENPTEKEKMERLASITLYSDGTAKLAAPMISSYYLPDCTYTVSDDELLIHARIKSEPDEEFFGVKDNDIMARFEIIDYNTIVFKSASVPLYDDVGALCKKLSLRIKLDFHRKETGYLRFLNYLLLF